MKIRLWSSWLWHRAFLYKDTDILEKHPASPCKCWTVKVKVKELTWLWGPLTRRVVIETQRIGKEIELDPGFNPEDEGNIFLRKIGIHAKDGTVS